MSNNSGNTLLALIAGAAIGVGAGILLAPEEGKEVRKKIKKSLNETANDLKQKIGELETEIKNTSVKTKRTFEEKMEAILSKGSHKADDVISVLEKKLAQLKEANAKLQK